MNSLKYKFVDNDNISLLKRFYYVAFDGREIIVPKHFVSDGISVPKLFHFLIKRFGPALTAGVVHDYLYWNKAYPRKYCDLVFYKCLLECNVDAVVAKAAYLAVRSCGWIYY